MVAASVTTRLDVNNPVEEVVVLEADDTETYVSKKFSTVVAAQATLMEDTGTLSLPLSLGISGNTVTLNCTGLSGDNVCLTLYGRK
jgi:hypothetical protein